MKHALKWIVENTLLAGAMVAAAAIAASVYVAGEISAGEYEMISRVYPKAQPPLREHIQQALAGGKITRWEFRDLFREAMDDAGGVMGWTRPESTVEAERENLRQTIAAGGKNG